MLTNRCIAWVLRLRASRSAQDDSGLVCPRVPVPVTHPTTIGLAQSKVLKAYGAVLMSRERIT